MTDMTKWGNGIDLADAATRLLLERFGDLDAQIAALEPEVAILSAAAETADDTLQTLHNRRVAYVRAIVEINGLVYDARPSRDLVRARLTTLSAERSAYRQRRAGEEAPE